MIDYIFLLARITEAGARIRYEQQRVEDATSEASHALEIYGKAGATKFMEDIKDLLRDIEETKKTQPSSQPVGFLINSVCLTKMDAKYKELLI